MRSIVEEASSIVKAIEKGWIKAGKPKEFSIKIFEESKKNFFGITTRFAKIGIFFQEEKPQSSEYLQQNRYKENKNFVKNNYESKYDRDKYMRKNLEEFPKNNDQLKINTGKKEIWTKEMQENIKLWLNETLSYINLKTQDFSMYPHNFYLKIKFNKPIFEEKWRERQLFSSLANLFLQMLRNKYKRPLKGYKIVLQTGW